jgi:hypothetical protein
MGRQTDRVQELPPTEVGGRLFRASVESVPQLEESFLSKHGSGFPCV